MIREHIHVYSIQIMPPQLQRKHHSCKLQVMSGIILFMNPELSGSIGYHLTNLHKNTSQTNLICITIDSVILVPLRQSKHRG